MKAAFGEVADEFANPIELVDETGQTISLNWAARRLGPEGNGRVIRVRVGRREAGPLGPGEGILMAVDRRNRCWTSCGDESRQGINVAEAIEMVLGGQMGEMERLRLEDWLRSGWGENVPALELHMMRQVDVARIYLELVQTQPKGSGERRLGILLHGPVGATATTMVTRSAVLNPTQFRAEVDNALELWRSGRSTELAAVAMIEMPRRRLADPKAGAEALWATAREARMRLEAALGEGDRLGQFGEAAFGVMLGGIASRQAAKERVSELLGLVNRPFLRGGREVEVTARAGLAFPDSGQASAEELLRDADAALELATRRKLGFAALPEPRVIPASHVEVIETELRRAIEQQEIFFEFQPVYEVSTGRIAMLEALSRWRHPRLGPLAPTSFIAAAEDSGLVLDLDVAGLERLARQIAGWKESGAFSPEILYTINMSGCHFPEFIQEKRVFEVLREERMRGVRLAFEVTETAFLEGDAVTAQHLQRLRNEGVQIWLDDFGDGHSSIRYLVDFPLDGVKVSEYFVRRAMDEPKARAVLASMRKLTKSLGLELVAEGVETREQWEMLRNMGYERVQGFYCSRALSAERVADVWQEERSVSWDGLPS